MTKIMPITPTQLMCMKPGTELDELVTSELFSFIMTGISHWSTNESAALRLMETIEEHVTQVGLLLMGSDAPLFIGKMAMVGEHGEATMVFTDSWQESLSKAFILFQHGFTGEYFDPRFEEAKKNAPKRVVN